MVLPGQAADRDENGRADFRINRKRVIFRSSRGSYGECRLNRQVTYDVVRLSVALSPWCRHRIGREIVLIDEGFRFGTEIKRETVELRR
jgi:hypothetical protein